MITNEETLAPQVVALDLRRHGEEVFVAFEVVVASEEMDRGEAEEIIQESKKSFLMMTEKLCSLDHTLYRVPWRQVVRQVHPHMRAVGIHTIILQAPTKVGQEFLPLAAVDHFVL